MYIIFDSSPNFSEGMPAGLYPLAQNSNNDFIFKLSDGYSIPDGGREATINETRPSADVFNAIVANITAIADNYQNEYLGTTTPQCSLRYHENLEMALYYKSNNTNPDIIYALQLQANALAYTTNTEVTIDQYINWFINTQPNTRMVTGEVNAFLMKTIHDLNTTNNLVDPLVMSDFINNIPPPANVSYSSIVV